MIVIDGYPYETAGFLKRLLIRAKIMPGVLVTKLELDQILRINELRKNGIDHDSLRIWSEASDKFKSLVSWDVWSCSVGEQHPSFNPYMYIV